MRGLSEEVPPEVLSPAEVDALITAGRFDRADAALESLQQELPELERAGEPLALLQGLYGRGTLLRLIGAPTEDVLAAADLLERAAQERRHLVWVATACAMRARAHVDAGNVGAAMGDLGRVNLDQFAGMLDGTPGFSLLEVLAAAYARLRLNDRLDEVRGILDTGIDGRSVVERATHWAAWSTELAGRGLEPIADGTAEPDFRLLGQAVDVAVRLAHLPPDAVPDRLHRTTSGVRALAAAYRGRASEALRLLGRDAFTAPLDLPAMERQVVTLAAMHAHALLGSVATARSLDEAATQHVGALPDLVLEVARARERLWLETQVGGDVIPVLYRLTGLLVRLGWQGMDLVADTARQALEHQVLRTESRTDPLTGVGNRRALDEELRHLLRFGPLPVAMVLIDIDDFKWVNDQFSHSVGDEVLRQVAISLSEQLRIGDKILRYGGDEFVMLLPRTGDQEARQVADRMSRAIARLPWSELSDGLRVGITTGCAALWSLSGRRPDGDAGQLFRQADEALLEAKRERNTGVTPDTGPAGRRPRPGHGRRSAGPVDQPPSNRTVEPARSPARPRRRHAAATSEDLPTAVPVSQLPDTATSPPDPWPPAPAPRDPEPVNHTPVNHTPASQPPPAPPAPEGPLPANPVPVSPAQANPLPVSPVPVSPAQANPLPVSPAQANPLPVSPAQANQLPMSHAPVSPLPANPASANPLPVNPLPVNPLPVNPLPVNHAPVSPVPGRPWPVDAVPSGPEPSQPVPPTPAQVPPAADHPATPATSPPAAPARAGQSGSAPDPGPRPPARTSDPRPWDPSPTSDPRPWPGSVPQPDRDAAPGGAGVGPPQPARPDPIATTWRSTPLAADPLTSRSASDRMLTPPPEPGRTSSWAERRADPSTGSIPLDPAYLAGDRPRPAPTHRFETGGFGTDPTTTTRSTSPNGSTGSRARGGGPERDPGRNPFTVPDTSELTAPGTGDLPQAGGENAPQRARRRTAVIDLGATESPSRTPFG